MTHRPVCGVTQHRALNAISCDRPAHGCSCGDGVVEAVQAPCAWTQAQSLNDVTAISCDIPVPSSQLQADWHTDCIAPHVGIKNKRCLGG